MALRTSPTNPDGVRDALPAARNLAKASLLLAGVSASFSVVGYALGGYRLLVLFGACAVLLAGAVYWYGDRAILGMLGARDLPVGAAPALHATVERLAARAGVPVPRVSLLDDGYPRALSVGRGPRSATVVVSRGLLTAGPPEGTEAVLALELAHIRNRDVLVQTTAVVLASTLVELSRIGGFLERALLFVLGPLASAFVHLLLSPRRELAADRFAAAICDSPHDLADALLRLDRASELVQFRASPTTEPLYSVNPFAVEGLAALFVTHPPLEKRVRRLRELDPDWREKLRAA